VRPKAIKILEGSTGSNVSDTGQSNTFLDTSPGARETKAKMNYWGQQDKRLLRSQGHNQQN